MKRAALGLLLLAVAAQACIELFGDAKDSVAVHTAATHWNYGFRGDDWTGKDAAGNPWVCQTGTRQSPMNLPHASADVALGPLAYRTSWTYGSVTSNGTNVQIFNNGHTIQVQWAAGVLTSEVLVSSTGKHVTDVLAMGNGANDAAALKRVKATPLQFHFHTDSEHAIDGAYYPLELHIVHNVAQADLPSCPAGGCFTVTGIMLALSEEDNPALDTIWQLMPMREGLVVNAPAGASIDVGALLPADRTYINYEGSLTTPPCTEGLLWHVLTTPIPISLNQLRKYQRAVGIKDCVEKGADVVANTTDSSHARLLSEGAAGDEDHAHTHAHAHAHHHHHHQALGHKQLIERGMKSGFTLLTTQPTTGTRRMLEEASSPDNFTCTVVSYGFSNRNAQPAHDRVVRVFPWPQSTVAVSGATLAAVMRDISDTQDSVEEQRKLILGIGLGIGLGCTFLVLVSMLFMAVMLRSSKKDKPSVTISKA